jgi:hypothetical protein
MTRPGLAYLAKISHKICEGALRGTRRIQHDRSRMLGRGNASERAEVRAGRLAQAAQLFVFGFLAFAPNKECCRCLITKFGLA